jgi:hypothetical protein
MQTNPTLYSEINKLLELLLSSMQKILGEKLVGLYLYGSLVIRMLFCGVRLGMMRT